MQSITDTQKSLERSLLTSFIDANVSDSDPHLRADLLCNSVGVNGEYIKVLPELLQELKDCDSFDISVAFITQGGLSLLKQTLKDDVYGKRSKDKVKGRLLTTDYNLFTDPRALREIEKNFPELEIKLYRCENSAGFHTKGFMFTRGDECRFIIGSSNLTQNALTKNFEWNVRLVSHKTGQLPRKIKSEFEYLWEHPHSFPLDQVIDAYEIEWRAAERARKQKKKTELPETPVDGVRIEPNSMQKVFIKNVTDLYLSGQTKALLISATGTGKTYAAALAVRHLMNLNTKDEKASPKVRKAPKKILFIVHREQIAIQAKKSFERVIGTKNLSYGLVSGHSFEIDKDLVFGTMQTLSKAEVLKEINPKNFDLVVIDEVHRAGADSYSKIMAHLQPDFWLGMTASPDRPDGKDIYKIFDNNIAYEIRLQGALEEDLLVPFRYYGIADLEIDSLKLDKLKDFSCVEFDQRVDHVIKQAEVYGHAGDRVKGLVFCRTIEECAAFSEKFNKKGFKTVALSGKDLMEKRLESVEKLSHGEGEGRLDYIFSVDIFNEGIDVPEINQVIFLRPTESPIIFVQQLGRGLRKAEDKEFLVVLDFIANYQNNYLIPVALSGDNSYDKDVMRKVVGLGTRTIPGASTIEFQAVVKQRILDSIDTARINDAALLKESYRILKNKLGRIPRLTEYRDHNGIDPVKFFMNPKYRSYYGFLKENEESYQVQLTPRAESMIRYLSSKLGAAKRIEECILLRLALQNPSGALKEDFECILQNELKIKPSPLLLNSVFNNLSANFFRNEIEKKGAGDVVFVTRTESGDFRASNQLKEELENNGLGFRDCLEDLLDFMTQRYEDRFSKRYKDTSLCLYEKYSYEDVCRLLNWPKNPPAQNIGGYKYDETTKTLPVFVNYHKAEDAIAYEDRFESEKNLIALSKTKRSVDSDDAKRIYKQSPENEENKIYLFVRKNKNDSEAKSFYFLGEMKAEGEPEPVKVPSGADPSKMENAFEIQYVLDTPVRNDIYDYLCGE